MGALPSIKGSVFAGVVEDVRKLVDGGAIARSKLGSWLQPEDLGLLDEKILVSVWYDIRSYQRMCELLRDVAGNGSNEYLRERGRETARRLLQGGLYAQLEYLNRTEVAHAVGAQARFEAFGRDLRKLTTMSASILNFSVWTPNLDPTQAGRYLIEVSEAHDFPEVLCWRSDGFVNEMASRHGEGDLWRWRREGPDRIVFRMRRDP
jgi:hypothetical protein